MKVVINLSTGRFTPGQIRLRNSIAQYGKDVGFNGYLREQAISAPPHNAHPYAFKPYGFVHARNMGNKQIFWADASVFAVKDIEPVFGLMAQDGYFMHEAGHWCGTWANDNCLKYFGITRDEAMTMPMFTAGCFGLDLDHDIASNFLTQWYQAAVAGIFRGAWGNSGNTESQDPRCEGHRHDMVCGSIIANQLGMTYQNGNKYLAYAGPNDPVNDTIVFKLQGMA